MLAQQQYTSEIGFTSCWLATVAIVTWLLCQHSYVSHKYNYTYCYDYIIHFVAALCTDNTTEIA